MGSSTYLHRDSDYLNVQSLFKHLIRKPLKTRNAHLTTHCKPPLMVPKLTAHPLGHLRKWKHRHQLPQMLQRYQPFTTANKKRHSQVLKL